MILKSMLNKSFHIFYLIIEMNVEPCRTFSEKLDLVGTFAIDVVENITLTFCYNSFKGFRFDNLFAGKIALPRAYSKENGRRGLIHFSVYAWLLLYYVLLLHIYLIRYIPVSLM